MSSTHPSVPYGYCHCGCGRKTKVAAKTDRSAGYTQGEPRRFIAGHNRRSVVGDWPIEVTATGCHLWLAARTTAGYGEVWDGKVRYAHRVAYERTRGPIPAGLHIDHLCRNRACVNPDHLEPVTNAENLRRGRGTKLTVEDVLMIRKLAADGTPVRAIHARFPVAEPTIYNIIARRTWVDV